MQDKFILFILFTSKYSIYCKSEEAGYSDGSPPQQNDKLHIKLPRADQIRKKYHPAPKIYPVI